MQTAPVLAVLVCHDGEEWLPLALSALRRGKLRPQQIIAVDTGSTDRTAELLAQASDENGKIVDSVLRLSADAGFAEAVAAAVQHADITFDERARWLWLLHDDCAPEPDCLSSLLNTADASPSAGVLGPLAVDWADPRLIVEAGLSTDASGHRHRDAGLDKARVAEQSTEVLAVPSAGALIDRQLWDDLGGFDEELPLLREDLDFGWRANVAGKTVLCVPRARVRHACALGSGKRVATALSFTAATGPTGSTGPATVLAADRAHGLRTFLVNCSTFSFVIGLPRLILLSALRGIGLLVLKENLRARAEFAAIGFLLSGHGMLNTARARRAEVRRSMAARTGGRLRRRNGVRGLFVSRLSRLRLALRAAVRSLVRRRVASEVALGRLPESTAARSTWIPPEELRSAAFAGGLPRDVVAVPIAESSAFYQRIDAGTRAAERERTAETADASDTAAATGAAATAEPAEPAALVRRPSPGTGHGGGLVFVEVNRKRILAATLFAPPLLLAVGLTLVALAVNWQRLGLDLAGGRLLPLADLGQTWSSYLAGWHPAGGGTSAQSPAALAVIGILGGLCYPIGGPAAAVALLFLLNIPLAALSAYAATRRLPVHRWVRALLASVYAVLPPATAAVAQGRIDVVVVHVLLPLVIAGIAGVLRPVGRGERWLSAAVVLAFGVAVVGAFSPLVHAMVLAGLLLGFVFVHSEVRLSRRIAGVAVAVLLPIAVLLPWPTTLLTHPELVLHGIGGRVAAVEVSAGELLSLDPGGPGARPFGIVLVIVALIALIVRPTFRALPGLGIVLLGVAGVAMLQLFPASPAAGGDARTGWTGAPLLVIAVGLLAVMLAALQQDLTGRAAVGLRQRLAVGAGAAVLVTLLGAAVSVGGEGPLRPAGPVRLADALAVELAESGRSVLELRADGDPPRVAGGTMPRFGDDDLAVPAGTPERLTGWQQVLLSGADGPPTAVRDAVAAASMAGVLFVVLPPGVDAAGVIEAGGELVTTATPLADGRQVVRLKPPAGQVTLIAPELSKMAISGKPPPGDIEGEGVAVIDANLPGVRVRVSDGPGGRLLVLAATHEAGWVARVNGEPVPIVPAWGHQVGVEVPTRAADVVVDSPRTVRNLLLLAQVGALLFMVLTAIPGKRSRMR